MAILEEHNDAQRAHALETHRPLIGITPRQETADGTVVLKNNYPDAVMAAGGIPFVLPIIHDRRILQATLETLDGIILTGGHDIDPVRYGGDSAHPKLSELTPERDQMESFILDYALEHDMPLVGVCRGMQFLNVHLGGTLYMDLGEAKLSTGQLQENSYTPWIPVRDQYYPDVREDRARQASGAAREVLDEIKSTHGLVEGPIYHWQTIDYGRTSHYVRVEEGTMLGSLIGAGKHAVNSMHHQGVRDVSPRVRVAARATDGLVEAIEVTDRAFMLGVQWHPEFFAGDKFMGPLFGEFVRQSAAYAGSSR